MCYFITLSIDRSFANTMNYSTNDELHVQPNYNVSLNKHLPKNFVSFDLLLRGCSCGLYDPDYGVKKKLIAKYRKKRWTAAKIERAIADAIANKNIWEGLREDVKCFIKNWVIQTKYVIFFIHWYSGLVDSEKIEKVDNQTLRLEEFYHHPKIEEDVFYHIKLT